MTNAHQVEPSRVEPADEGQVAGPTAVGGGSRRRRRLDDNRRALEALCAAVPTELGASLANKATAKLMWESIAAARVGGGRVRRATLQRLRGEWEGLAFQPGEQVEDFTHRLTNLMEQMARNGDTDLTEDRAVEKFLRYMPKRYA